MQGRCTGGDYLRAVEGWLPRTLVSAGSLRDMVAVADHFVVPASVLIECPLGDATVTADLSLSFARPDPAGEGMLLAADSWPPGPAWDRLHRFVAAWRDPAGPLWHDVRSLWLELDLRAHPATADAPIPNVFFGNSRGLRSRATIRSGLDLMRDREHTGVADTAAACLDALPAGATILFVGLMLARQPEVIRICIDAPPGQEVSRYFEEIALCKWPERSRSSMGDLFRHARHVVAQVEAGTDVGARVGFELYLGRRHRGRADAWRPLLQRLIEEGRAREDRCASALAWPGFAYDDHLGPRVIARWINHVKLVYEAGSLTEAKVYLQCGTAWSPPPSDTAELMAG